MALRFTRVAGRSKKISKIHTRERESVGIFELLRAGAGLTGNLNGTVMLTREESGPGKVHEDCKFHLYSVR
ncbi:hypothetical protein GCM10008937_06750 [Deinococcus depolymerans]|uniref:Uncharacterized protein n=1 Tax=Deinococcus depolymerans TaxID=392408 RepID=A0ABN1BNJ2_9DEIO